MKEYRIVTTPSGNEIIQYDEGNTTYSIPKDPANSDYQAYLAWLENPQGQQSTPIPTE